MSAADDDLADGAERSSGRWPAPDDTKADGWLLALQLLMAAAVAVGVAAFWVYVCQRCWCARRLARATRPRATIRIVHKSSTIVEDLWTDLNRRSSEAAAGAVQASERRSAKWGSDEWTAPTFDRRFASPRAREKAGVTAAAAAASAAAATPIDAARAAAKVRAAAAKELLRGAGDVGSGRVGGGGDDGGERAGDGRPRVRSQSAPHVDVEISTLGALPPAPAPEELKPARRHTAPFMAQHRQVSTCL